MSIDLVILRSSLPTTTRPFCLEAHLRALDECSTHKTKGLHPPIQPRKRPFKPTTFSFLDTTATNERTPDSTSMTLEERTPTALPHIRHHIFGLFCLSSPSCCDLYIPRGSFLLLFSRFHRGIGFFNGMMFFHGTRMDTPRFLPRLIDYELRHLIFPCLWRRGRWIPGLGWWIGGMGRSLDPVLEDTTRMRV